MRDNDQRNQPREFDEKVVQVSRVSKKTKGGNKVGFSVLMVVGDRKGQVGVALGKAPDVLASIKKGVRRARKKMFTVPMDGTTIPFPVEIKHGAARILLSPAPRGSGVIAGGPIRAVVEAAGIRDISAKILGTNNKASNVYATFEALRQIRDIVELRGMTLKSVAEEERELKEKEREEQREAKEKAAAQEAAEKKSEAKKTAEKKAAAPKKAAPAKKAVAAEPTSSEVKEVKEEKPKKEAAPKKAAPKKAAPAKKPAKIEKEEK